MLDVRENDEFEFVNITPSIHIPLSQLAQRYQEIPSDRPLFVICHFGGRSMRACQFLSQFGYETFNVMGGIDAWSVSIDNSKPRY